MDADESVERIRKAYEYAKQNLGNIREGNRQTYFASSVRAARRMAEIKLGERAIIVCLLHHVIYDGKGQPKEIEELFGKKILNIVDEIGI